MKQWQTCCHTHTQKKTNYGTYKQSKLLEFNKFYRSFWRLRQCLDIRQQYSLWKQWQHCYNKQHGTYKQCKLLEENILSRSFWSKDKEKSNFFNCMY